MTHTQDKKRNPPVGLIIGAIIGLLLVLGILYLLLFQRALPWDTSVKARTLTSVNLRQGPGTGYVNVGDVPAATEVTVVGRSEDGSWLLVRTDAGYVWMTGSPEYVEIDLRTVTNPLSFICAVFDAARTTRMSPQVPEDQFVG